MTTPSWFHARGSLAEPGWDTVVTAGAAGQLNYTGLRVTTLAAGQSRDLPANNLERLVVPLAGSFTLTVDGVGSTELTGRGSVFAGPTDTFYLPSGMGARLSGRGRVAVAEAPTDLDPNADQYPPVHLPRDAAPIELRGAGSSTRQVHNFGTPAHLAASRFIVCEVITPGGNTSSHPAHKHDELIPGHESRLEEIYYFELAPAPGVADTGAGVGFFATAGDGVLTRSGDVALVPEGYHGPASAVPGYDLYYLNVMAGPDPERTWLITDDPAHAWVRTQWDHQVPDPRLPYHQET